MNDFISYCGLDCEKCEARIATITNDDKLREKVAALWSKLNSVTITKEMINCVGCRLDGVKTPFCESLCEIRKCAIENKYEMCGACSKIMECEKIKMITNSNEEALKRLKDYKK